MQPELLLRRGDRTTSMHTDLDTITLGVTVMLVGINCHKVSEYED